MNISKEKIKEYELRVITTDANWLLMSFLTSFLIWVVGWYQYSIYIMNVGIFIMGYLFLYSLFLINRIIRWRKK